MSTKKAEARERVKAMREEQARKDRARERMMRLGIAGAVLVGVAIIAVAVLSNQDDGDGPLAVPANSAGEGEGILIGDPDAPVTIDAWIDFLCPHCKTFEDTSGPLIDRWVDEGQVNIVQNPVTYTGQVNSTRANNALACAADEGMADEFLKAAFANPQQWTNNSLVDLGAEIGIGGDYESCVRDETYYSWSSSVTDAARDADVTGTPTVFVDGELVEDWSPQGLTAAVEAAGVDVGTSEGETGEETEGASDDAQDEGNGDNGGG